MTLDESRAEVDRLYKIWLKEVTEQAWNEYQAARAVLAELLKHASQTGQR